MIRLTVFSILALGSVAAQASAPSKTTVHETIKKITKAPAPVKNEELHIEALVDGEALPTAHVETEPAPGVNRIITRGVAQEAEPKPEPKTEPKPEPAAHAPAEPAASASVPAPTPKQLSSSATAKAVDATTSLRWLTNGNTRFVTKRNRADGRAPSDRERVFSNGDHPHAAVLACSDSRVPPELVFDQALGEIYTIRSAGETLDTSVIASVEHAVETLGVKLLVVMGHTKCDVVDAALQLKTDTPLEKILGDVRQRLKSVPADKVSPNLEIEATVNADGVARELVKRSDLIRKRVESGDLVIKSALYRMDSGRVSFY